MRTSAAMPEADLRSQPPPDPPSAEAAERDLLKAAAAGDREAAGEIVQRTYRTIYAALYRLTGGDQELAADLAQDTYRKAWSALPGFKGRARLATWLYRIAYTTFLNHVRRPRLMVPLEDGHDRFLSDPAPPSDALLERRQEAERLRKAVMELPEPLRLTVTARYWAELPVRDIARAEGLTQPAVRKRLAKALRILGHAMEVAS